MKNAESLAEKYIQKGMHLGDNEPEKGMRVRIDKSITPCNPMFL